MELLGCCYGCRAEPPRGTSSQLGRGWEGAGGHGGDEKLGVRDPACSLLQHHLPGIRWDRMGCPSCSIPFPAGRSWAQLREDGAGWIHPWGKAGSSEQLQMPPARPQPQHHRASCLPPPPDPLYWGAVCPKPGTSNAGEERGWQIVPGCPGHAASPVLAGVAHGPAEPLGSLLPAGAGSDRATPSHW